jgi:hypothetical protein
MVSILRYRRVRRGAAAVLLTFAAWHACAAEADKDPKDQCIVGDGAIGCVSERALIELTVRRKDAGTLRELVRDKLISGQCRLFDYGERVWQITAHGTDRTLVRRSGDKTPYWIAGSWSRPAEECKDTPTAAALHQKLGFPRAQSLANEQEALDERDRDFSDGRFFSDERDRDERGFLADRGPPGSWSDDQDDDDDQSDGLDDRRSPYDRPSPHRSRPLPSSRYAHDCTYKPVMSDADLNACRNLRR